jgi:hypothetical protein
MLFKRQKRSISVSLTVATENGSDCPDPIDHSSDMLRQYKSIEHRLAERFNRTIKLMIEKYLTSKNTNRWIDNLPDFVHNYNSSFHSSIAKIPERLEMFDEAELIRKSIAHNNKVTDSAIKRSDFVRLLNKRGAFEKEGQRFTLKIYIVEEVGLNSVRVEGKHQKFNMYEVLKVSPLSQ